ncbi:hypothetical protein KI387_016620, partial [Taxus chinensis]
LRDYNDKADSLAVSASLLLPHPQFKHDTYSIKIVYRPSIPDNATHWQVFNDDQQVLAFLEKADNF